MKATLKKTTLSSTLATVLAAGCALAVANDQLQRVNATTPAPEVAVAEARFSADAMKVLDARIAKASRIANAIRELSPMNEAQFVGLSHALLGASDAGLEAAASAKSQKGALAAIRAANAKGMQKDLGSTSTDFVFKPIVPCRLLDTRAGAGLRLTGGVAYGVDFDGGNDGNAPGCTFAGVAAQTGPVGSDFAALVINVTVTQPLGPGHIRVRPVGSTLTASTQNFTTGQTVANMAIVQDAGTVDEFELWASTDTHAIVDVLGVLAPAAATALSCTNVLNATDTTVPLHSFMTVFDGSIAACPATYTGVGYIWVYQAGIGGLSIWDNDYGTKIAFSTATYGSASDTNIDIRVGRRCCRVPGS